MRIHLRTYTNSYKLQDRLQSRSSGFTILELMIATAVFGVILLVVAAGVISFTNSYYKGIIRSNTQNTAQSIMLNLTQAIQLSKSDQALNSGGSSNISGLCIDGTTLYSWQIGQEVVNNSPNPSQNQAYHGLTESHTDCSASSAPILPPKPGLPKPDHGVELLNQNMRLGKLSITQMSSNLWQIQLKVIYGSNDLLYPTISGGSTDWALETCSGHLSGSQFCAVASLSSYVQQRLQ